MPFPFERRIVVDGNDGTGKTTLVQALRRLGLTAVVDRGEMTQATDDSAVGPRGDTRYVLLVCPWQLSKSRLAAAGSDMSDPYHSDEALQQYDQRFRELAPRFDAVVCDTALVPIEQLVLTVIGTVSPTGLSLGVPKGRLAADHFESLLGGVLPMDAPWLDDDSRRLTWQSDALTILRCRTKVYPQMVAQGALDLAICGSDSLDPSPYAPQLDVLVREPQVGVRLVVASPTGEIPRKALLRVVSPFGELARAYFGERGIPHTIFEVPGGSEGMVPRFADVTLDITETGATLEAHGLRVVDDLGTLDACLVRRKV